jgi:hypothetical protein
LVLRALTVAAAGLALLTGCGHPTEVTRVENRRAGFTLLVPHDWHVRAGSPLDSSEVMLSSYPIARLGDITETPPRGETWLLLLDYGPLWVEPGWRAQFRPLPSRLPHEAGIEGFGSGRNLSFEASGHLFQAFIKGEPEPAATLGILRSIRITPFGRTLALRISRQVMNGVRVWRVGNPRSRRKLIVVGCPGLAKGCSGFAVTNRLVNGLEPLAVDLWVIERLRGREDVLARLQHLLHPEATIRLGSIRDPDAWTRRLVSLAR